MKKLIPGLLFSCLSCLTVFGQYNRPYPYAIDSLQQLLSRTASNDDSTRFELLFQLGMANQSVNADKSIYYVNESLRLAKSMNSRKRIISCLLTLSFAYSEIGESPKAIEMLQQVIHYSEKDKDASYIMAIAFLGKNYSEQGEYDKALIYTRDAFLLSEKQLRDTALPFDAVAFIAGPLELGKIYEKTNHPDSALYFAKETYRRILQHPNPYFFCQACNLLGHIYSGMNQPADAVRFYRLAISKAMEINLSVPLIESQLAIAGFYFKNNETDSAVQCALQAYQGARSIKLFNTMKESALLLRTIYEKKDLFEKALQYNDLAVAARDSVTGAEKVRAVQKLSYQEETRQQKMQQQIDDSRKAYQTRVKVYSLLAVIAGVLLLAFILYRNNRQKHQANILLQQEKQKVDMALSELRSTQSQLIQSEKMASLGELTAGIAHEIQNPLNFVNNFSEVSNELIEEMKTEMLNNNREDAIAIADDLKRNLEKINHHGKRADAIVKGMLQHSRSSSATKEPADINKLADEYLRLAYHGLQAKDKSFNAALKTDFDDSIGNINIIPQDIGRVLLNLINNAFYAVGEKKKHAGENYEPTVSLSTKKISNRVEIEVTDNGNGIAQKIIDKIFQPFFTTKPTGQGTGLGLSLAYDIVKAHGGELTVTTQDQEGSTFTVKLPS